MALAGKVYNRIYENGGSGTDALTNAEQLEFKRQFEDNEYIVDENFKEAFGVILYAIQSLSEDIDEIRRFTYTSTAAGDLGAVLASNSKVTTAVSADNSASGLHNSLAGHQHITDTSVTGQGSYWLHSRDISDLTTDEKDDYGYKSYGLNIYSGDGEGSWYDFNQTLVPNDSTNRTSGAVEVRSGYLFNTGSGTNNTGGVNIRTGSVNYSAFNTPLTLVCSAGDDSDTVTHSVALSGTQVVPGATVTGTGIANNTTVISVAANRESFTISKNTTAAISGGTLTFTSAQYNAAGGSSGGSGNSQSGAINIATGVPRTTSGNATSGSVTISTGMPWTDSGTAARGSISLNGSLVTVGSKLKITGNAIQDDDGVDCVTFDSSGNTTIGGALTVTGGITNAGTIAAGTWNGTAIASNYLDPDTAHLGGAQTFIGAKTFAALITASGGITSGFPITAESSIIMQGNRSVIASIDGRVMHVDAMDITDTTTTASGTSTAYNHVSIENPRLLASNASVTTTDASTLLIKGAPVASTNQTITNAWALRVAGGNCKFGGDLDVTGNVLPGITYVKILPSDFTPDDAGRPIMIDDTSSDRWLESHGTARMFASVQIPAGFKATHVDIYGDDTSQVTVYEADIDSKHVTSRGTGNIGTQINITDVVADATNYILIQLAQASGEEVYGGKLTIAKA
jgi:hypothetical protein